jgi:hypothetical protein
MLHVANRTGSVIRRQMQSTIRKVMRDAGHTTACSGDDSGSGSGGPPNAYAEANAKRMLKASSDYMAAEKAFSFDYDTYLEVVTKQNQKLALASSGTMTVSRPNKIRATRMGGFADVEFVFDGKTVTMFGKNANAYAQVEAPGTIDQLIDELRNKYHRPIPGPTCVSDVYGQSCPRSWITKTWEVA